MKTGKFIPHITCSGTGPAVKEFNLFADELRKAHQSDVFVIKIKHGLLGEVKYIKYEIKELDK